VGFDPFVDLDLILARAFGEASLAVATPSALEVRFR
jgi:hypothetical protein